MSDSEKQYGWFSQQSKDNGGGTCFYSTPKGGEVEIFCTCSSNVDSPISFTDAVCVGEIVKWLGGGQDWEWNNEQE